MRFHIITIFPDSFSSFSKTSIIWNAIKKWFLELSLYKLNDFSPETSGHIDDKAYWMHWQVLRAEPLAKAINYIYEQRGKVPTIYFTPQWRKMSQELFESFIPPYPTSNEGKLILAQQKKNYNTEYIVICGHYEWIDERIIDLYVDYQISLWDFILTGWELPAQVFIDGITRLLPWVLGKQISHEEESFSKKFSRQKEYPVYTKPEVFEWLSVPSVLLSGNHKKIDQWKISQLR